MNYNCDLHIHSRFSFRTSVNLTLKNLIEFAQIQGLNCIGTGDILHQVWFDEVKQYNLKNTNIKLIPTVEITDKHNKHHLILFKNLKIVKKVKKILKNYGTLELNGRPTIKLEPFEICKLILKIKDVYIGPAHIFSPYTGCMPYYKTLEQTYKEYSSQIFFYECGLDAWIEQTIKVDELKEICAIKSSDCHSLNKIGREYICVNLKYFSLKNLINSFKLKKISYVSSIPGLAKWYTSEMPLSVTTRNKRKILGVNELLNTKIKNIVSFKPKIVYKILLKEIIKKIDKKNYLNLYNQIILKYKNEHNLFLVDLDLETDSLLKYILKIYKNPLDNVILTKLGGFGQEGEFKIRSE